MDVHFSSVKYHAMCNFTMIFRGAPSILDIDTGSTFEKSANHIWCLHVSWRVYRLNFNILPFSIEISDLSKQSTDVYMETRFASKISTTISMCLTDSVIVNLPSSMIQSAMEKDSDWLTSWKETVMMVYCFLKTNHWNSVPASSKPELSICYRIVMGDN